MAPPPGRAVWRTVGAERVSIRVRTVWRSSYWRYLGLAMLAYLGLYGWLIATTRGLPYIMDGNESFATLMHASNLFHFGLGSSFGLTDEAYGSNPAAHPFVYSHEGNFPRVFAFLLYVLGAQTIQSQIVITTFTIGTLGVFLIYHFFAPPC